MKLNNIIVESLVKELISQKGVLPEVSISADKKSSSKVTWKGNTFEARPLSWSFTGANLNCKNYNTKVEIEYDSDIINSLARIFFHYYNSIDYEV
jgi:hypothetical protein